MSAFDLQLKAALVGDFDKEVEAGRRRVAIAAQAAMKDQAQDLVGKLRTDVSGSSMRGGGRLANTWRARNYANTGLDPAALVWSKAPLIVSAFERGETIKNPSGRWLTIPNPDLRIRLRRRGRTGRSVFADYDARYGKLRFVKIRPDLALLVADLAIGRTGKFRRVTETRSRRGQKVQSVVVLYLVREARMPRLLRGSTIRARTERDFPSRFSQAFERYLDQASREGGQLALADLRGGVDA